MTTLLQQLVAHTGLRELDVLRTAMSAPERYKVYTIPKRNGGERIIAQPAREVKALQHALIDILLAELPVHSAATAYRRGLSTLHNAAPHAGHRPIIKMDFRNFFPSITAQDWVSYCHETGCLSSDEDIKLSSRLLFRRDWGSSRLKLSIGAPSSPILSNVLMLNFDSQLVAALGDERIAYTRYADDMTFSAPRTGYMVDVVKTVHKVVRELKYPKLEVNRDKTTYVTTKYGRRVTGLTLANDGRITIGRDRKRQIHAAVHKVKLGELGKPELRALAGMLAYAKSVEPSFLETLAKKYGPEVVHRIQRAVEIPSQ